MSAKVKRVGVLLGGLSREREISLRTGKAVGQALRSLGYSVVEIDVGRDLASRLREEKIEVAFVALHGRYGEDGSVQGLLELMGIPYTGSGVAASAIAMDKDLTKRLVQTVGVRVPAWKVVHRDVVGANLVFAPGRSQGSPLPLPVIVKPNREGSTIGMAVVREADGFSRALAEAFQFDSTVLIEEYIEGREVTVGMLQQTTVGAPIGAPLLLPLLEVVPKEGFYDFKAKYTKGMTEYRVPAVVGARVQSEIEEESRNVWRLLGLRGVARADFMIDREEKSWFLEVNTIPGMTETSLVPKAAAAIGISFNELCEEILKGASA